VPYAAAQTLLPSLPLKGKTVIDASNPLNWADGPVHAPANGYSSGAAHLQALLPDAHIVKAFNTFGAEHITGAADGERPLDHLFAGNHADAKTQVAELMLSLNMRSIDLGPLRNAATIEHLAVAWIHLAIPGRRVSMNVEVVGGQFMVQHYLETIAQRDHVRGVSPNTTLWVDDEHDVLARITWDLQAKPLDATSSELICTVTAETEKAPFAERVQALNAGIPFEDRAFQKHVDEEPPLFAQDMERKALAGVWSQPPTPTAKTVQAMLEQLYNDGDPTLLRQLVAEDVRHFSSAVGDGVAAWEAFAASKTDGRPLIQVYRTVQDGDRIGVHAHYRWNAQRQLDGGPGVAVAHLFTVREGQIVDAVEVTQSVHPESLSGHDMFSQVGASVPGTDPAHNRKVAERVVTE